MRSRTGAESQQLSNAKSVFINRNKSVAVGIPTRPLVAYATPSAPNERCCTGCSGKNQSYEIFLKLATSCSAKSATADSELNAE